MPVGGTSPAGVPPTPAGLFLWETGAMELPDVLVELPGGEIILRGHRIALQNIVDRVDDGYTLEMLLHEYPTLSRVQLSATMDFYAANREEVSKYVMDIHALIDRLMALSPKKGPDMADVRRRAEAFLVRWNSGIRRSNRVHFD